MNKIIPLILLAMTAAACPHRETQRSRDYAYCVYEARYGYKGLNSAQRLAAEARCRK